MSSPVSPPPSPDLYQVTLASIGDAVIATDLNACITFMNQVAVKLTGWPMADAVGMSLVEVFQIVNEVTRLPVENPALRALTEGHIVGLANHTVLLARDGREFPIEDSASPIKNQNGVICGAVLVFRDVSERRRAERAQTLLASIVESSDDAIISKNLDGTIVSWNRGAERIYGYTAREAIGHPILLIIPPDRYLEEKQIIERLKHGERIDHFETIRITKDGRPITVSITVSPVRDSNGRVVGASKVARDVTEQRKAEEAVKEQNRILEMLSAIGTRLAAELELSKLLQAITDETTALTGAALGAFFKNVADSHGGAYRLFNLSGAPRAAFEQFPHPRATKIFEPTFKGMGPVRLHDVTADPRFGQNPPYNGIPPGHLPVRSYLAIPVKSRSGEVFGGLFFGHPQAGVFTHRHEQIVVGVAAHASVAIENARLYEKLRETDRKKDEFLATLAHELRNPMAPIRTGVQVLKAGPTPQESKEILTMMERQAGHLSRLVDDLMDVARVTSGKIKLRMERVDVKAVVMNAIEASQALIQEHRHEISTRMAGEMLMVEGDVTRLGQVLSNLLTNAVKYTEPGGRIEVTVAREGAQAVVRIQDNGIGISSEMLPKVFDMFAQVGTSLERSQGGLGLGLTIVKKLIEMHHGTVTAVSAGESQGSTFTIYLPLAKESAGLGMNDHARIDVDVPVRKLRVLVIDDNRDGAATLALLIKLLGHQVEVAHSGTEGLEANRVYRPQVIFLDIGLPGMNGYEVARQIRSDAAFEKTHIVALTGWGSEEDRRKSRDAGCNEHFTKPVDNEEVKSVLTRLGRERSTE